MLIDNRHSSIAVERREDVGTVFPAFSRLFFRPGGLR